MQSSSKDPKASGTSTNPSRIVTNRLLPSKGTPVPKAAAGGSEETLPNRLAARKFAEERARARTLARAQAVAEKLSTATDEVASAIAEANSAVVELEKTMHAIASGAEQASSSAEESKIAINQIEKATDAASGKVDVFLWKINDLQGVVKATRSDIEELAKGVNEGAQANSESAKMVAELENQSEEIGKIIHAVARIADQTNLLALNAAIEAARAGEHGKGFAVVADEVRNLAEVSEKSARGIQEVVNEIQSQVKVVAADTETAAKKSRDEIERANAANLELAKTAEDFTSIQAACTEIRTQAQEALLGAKKYLKGAEEIAAASEEATSSCQEAQRSVQGQSKAYAEMNDSARLLAEMAESLKTSTNAKRSAEEMAATAEELAANAEEVKRSSAQISVAIEQINKSAAAQARVAEVSNLLGVQLLQSAKVMRDNAEGSAQKTIAIQQALAKNKENVDTLIANISRAAEASLQSAKNVLELAERTRRIDKIVETIVMVTVQTKMLAVNGNVEAARAGEYGRGFSVVADDIRALANESSQNTDRIKDLVKNVQSQISKIGSDIQATGSKARREVEKAKVSTANWELITRECDVLVSGIREISNGSTESTVALEQAAKASLQIATAAEQINRATTEAAGASEQGLRAAQEIAQAVDDIASQADELQNG